MVGHWINVFLPFLREMMALWGISKRREEHEQHHTSFCLTIIYNIAGLHP